MSLEKPDKPKWIAPAPVTDEPADSKKAAGWQPAERPPMEWHNWLYNQAYDWDLWGERALDISLSLMLKSAAPVQWTGANVVFTQDLQFIFKDNEDAWINSIPLADSPLALADGEVLVIILTDSNAVLTSAAYGAIAAGNYSIVAESSLTDNQDELEIVVFRRRGTELEIPLLNQVVASGGFFVFGGLAVHTHADNSEGGQLTWSNIWASDPIHDHENNSEGGTLDHGLALTGLADDDHTQYSLIAGTRAFTGKVQGVSTIGGDPAATLATKDYVDSGDGAVAGHLHTVAAGDGGQLVIQDAVALGNRTGTGVVVLASNPFMTFPHCATVVIKTFAIWEDTAGNNLGTEYFDTGTTVGPANADLHTFSGTDRNYSFSVKVLAVNVSPGSTGLGYYSAIITCVARITAGVAIILGQDSTTLRSTNGVSSNALFITSGNTIIFRVTGENVGTPTMEWSAWITTHTDADF